MSDFLFGAFAHSSFWLESTYLIIDQEMFFYNSAHSIKYDPVPSI